MRRKLSSSAEEDSEGTHAEASQPDHDKTTATTTFSTAKFDLTRHSDTLDRRKIEKALAPVQLLSDGWTDLKPQISSKKALLSGQTNNKMLEGRGRRRPRLRNPWSCSLLTLLVTLCAVLLLLSIIHSFTTLQLDAKGCDMYYTRSMFFHFADFDTEHTRFASKYSLHLYKEIGFDEDPKVVWPA